MGHIRMQCCRVRGVGGAMLTSDQRLVLQCKNFAWSTSLMLASLNCFIPLPLHEYSPGWCTSLGCLRVDRRSRCSFELAEDIRTNFRSHPGFMDAHEDLDDWMLHVNPYDILTEREEFSVIHGENVYRCLLHRVPYEQDEDIETSKAEVEDARSA